MRDNEAIHHDYNAASRDLVRLQEDLQWLMQRRQELIDQYHVAQNDYHLSCEAELRRN